MTARELKTYGVVSEATAEYKDLARQQRVIAMRSSVFEGLGAPIFRTSAALLIVVMIAAAATQGDSSVAGIGIVAVLLYRSSNYGTVLVGVHQRLARIVPIVDQLEEGLAKLWSNQIEPGHLDVENFEAIEARSVTYSYPGQTSPALVDVSLRVAVDEVIGIVGPSGGGKSTLAELLVGLRRPTDGTISVDDVDLSELSEHSRSGCIALVSQHVPLVPGTVRQNVRFFREITDADILDALRSAGLEAAVGDMPEGLGTAIGPGARALSGGQMQRLGIARALAGKPSIVVLDEPTSALDASAEEVVIDTIGRLHGTVGVVVIAHRLTTLRHCDRIVVLERGRVTDEGNMTDLRTRNGFVEHAFTAGRLE